MRPPAVECALTISGTLLGHAEARHRAIDGGAMAPVLCFTMQSDSASGGICHVQQLFPLGHEQQCEAAARRLRKDARVTVEAPSVGIELVIRNASHVHQLQAQPEAEATPA